MNHRCGECEEPQCRLHKAYQDAEFAFWAEVAKLFPEIQTGDMEPLVCLEMETKMKEWIAIWLNSNGDFPRDPEDYENEHLCNECGEIMVAAGVKDCDKCKKEENEKR